MRLALTQVGTRWHVTRDGALVGDFATDRTAFAALVAAAPPLPAAPDAPDAGLLADGWIGDPAIGFAAETGDGRDLSACEFTWRDPAANIVPLMLQTANEGHYGAELAGFVEEFWLEADGSPNARGRFYDNEAGRTFVGLLAAGRKFPVSMDGGKSDIEWACTNEVDGICLEEKANVLTLEIIGLTGVPMPAFAEAAIRIDAPAAEEDPEDPADTPADPKKPEEKAPPVPPAKAAVRASAFSRPARSLFFEPEPEEGDPRLVEVEVGLHGETTSFGVPLTIDPERQAVYGHLAIFGTCHIGYPGMCVEPPVSPTGYAHFNLAPTVCDDGSTVPTGPLVIGCDHAALDLFAQQARDHYAHAGLKWANVRASAGRYGVWVAGALMPGLTDAQLAALNGSNISGDWRDIGGALELIAGLTVSVPGFPLVRARAMAAAAGLKMLPPAAPPRARMSDGRQLSLVAAGRVRPCAPCAERKARPVTVEARLAALEAQSAETLRLARRLEARGRREAVAAAMARIASATSAG